MTDTSQKNIQQIDVQNIRTKEPLNDIETFLDFCKSDIQSAVQELKTIKTEANRKHLQKLVYVHSINRFDYLVDRLLLWFSINNDSLREEILRSIKEESISRKEVFELFFMKERSYDSVTDQIRDLARNGLLRERHANKLGKILATCLDWKSIKKPRVNKDGKIFASIKINKNQPNSIVGYADWLYSRRNSLVHGDGRQYDSRDFNFIRIHYNVNLPKTFRLQLASITSAINFYEDLLGEMRIKIEKSGNV